LRALGIDVYALRRRQLARRIYRANREEFMRQRASSRSGGDFAVGDDRACLADRFAAAGEARGHYFHQDLLVASWIHAAAPARHVDVGSRVDGFVAHVASFRPVDVIDIRPLATSWEQITFHQRDIT